MNPFRRLKEYEVWSEGFVVTGGDGQACLHGRVKARSFKEACQTLFKNNPTYDPKRNTLWGCGLFDNEKSARKSFG